MKKKIKKRFYMIIITIIVIIIIFHLPHNYKIEYKINNYKIYEEYNKDLKIHYFKINIDNKDYEFISSIKGRKLVENLDYFTNEKNKCLSISLKKEVLKPVCYENNTLKDIRLINDEELLKHYKIKENNIDNKINFNNITIHNLNSNKYLLWNYKGFYYLNKDITDNLKITDKDVYNLKIIAKIHNLLILANYQEEYNFNQFIIINFDNGKKEIWNIDYDISMDSYVLGTYKDSVYLVDKKNKIEYEIVPSHKKLRIVGNKKNKGIIYENGFKEITLNELVNKERKFIKTLDYNYYLSKNNLYLKLYSSENKRLVTKKENIKIIDTQEDTVYYLEENKLYSYSPKEGEILLLENFEWNFNFENMIFVFK